MSQKITISVGLVVLPLACAEVGTTNSLVETVDSVDDIQRSVEQNDTSLSGDVVPRTDVFVSDEKDTTLPVTSDTSSTDGTANDIVTAEDGGQSPTDVGAPSTDIGESSCQPPCGAEQVCVDDQCVPWDGTVAVSGKTMDVIGNKPVSGIEVCVAKHPAITCALTGDDGVFNLTGVPGQTKHVLTFNKVGYFPEHIMITTGKQALILPLTSAHATNEEATIVAQLGEVTLDPALGHIGIAVFEEAGDDTFDQTLPGATFKVVSPAASPGLYLADDGFPDKSRTKTSKNSRAFFFNIEAGPGVVSVSHPDYNFCIPVGFGWPSVQPSTMEVLVEPGTVTVGAFVCNNVPDGV